LAVENYKRAGEAENPELKQKFMQIAAEYRDLALQLDDPAERHAIGRMKEKRL
jgi:hypothetical protein